MSLLSLPPELLQIIAMNLKFEDVVNFQEASSIVRARTSDVSFYCSYFSKRYQSYALKRVYSFRDKISNWKPVAERLMKDNDKFAEFFYDNSTSKLLKYDRHIPVLIGCELVRFGHQVGDVFVSAENAFRTPRVFTMDTMHRAVFTLRKENPDLARAEQWPFFEEIFYEDLFCKASREADDAFTPGPEHIEVLFECMYFAETKTYETLQREVAESLNEGIIYAVGQGSVGYKEGLIHLAAMMPKLID